MIEGTLLDDIRQYIQRTGQFNALDDLEKAMLIWPKTIDATIEHLKIFSPDGIRVAVAEEPVAEVEPELIHPAAVLNTKRHPNEKAFFLGMSLSNISIKRVRIAGNQHEPVYGVTVTTESRNPLRSKALEVTLGRYGEVRNNQNGIKVVLPDNFNFLTDREKGINRWTFESLDHFAPFVLGFISMNPGETHRLAYANADVLNGIGKSFNDHFHFSMGNVSIRPDSGGSYIEMNPRKYASVMAALFSTSSVQKLPFRQALAQI